VTQTISWKRNLAAIWFAELTSIVGFAIAIPIMPFYVQELGVTDPDAVKFWAGLITTVHPITMAIMAPIWGTLADRYGRKVMLVRAMLGGAVVLGLMGVATAVYQLVILRAIQGMLTGTVTAANTLVASTTPRERSGSALGFLQMGIYAGASLGPVVGGVVSDALGTRAAFFTTSGLLLTGGLLVALFVRENFEPTTSTESSWRAVIRGFQAVAATPALLSALGIRLMMRMAGRLPGPNLSLFVEELVPAGRAATLAGLVWGGNAAAAAVGAVLLGWASDRIGRRRVLLACGVASALIYVPQFFVVNVTQLALLQGGAGFAMGGILATLSATLATFSPEGRQGVVYGVDASVVSAANALAPALGTALAIGWDVRAPFLGSAVVFAVGSAVTARLLPRAQGRPQGD
jgi:DHA1 family multidrug resistance protein-like MFS transporter